MFKIDAPPSSVIGGAGSMPMMEAPQMQMDPNIPQDEAAKMAAMQAKAPVHPSRYYSSVRLYPSVGVSNASPAIDHAAVERLTYIVEAQQASSNDMLTKLYQMHQEQLQQQTQQAQQLNASLQALLGESERYFHEVVQINQQLVGQLRDLFAATVQGAAEAGMSFRCCLLCLFPHHHVTLTPHSQGEHAGRGWRCAGQAPQGGRQVEPACVVACYSVWFGCRNGQTWNKRGRAPY
jgi:hypothetical protein